MDRYDNYPYSQIKEALATVVGRVMLVIIAGLFGSMLGGLTSMRSLWGLWEGLVGFPSYGVASIAYGLGAYVLPFMILFAACYVRFAWPLQLVLICTLLMWGNIHKTIRWTDYDSPAAKEKREWSENFAKDIPILQRQ